MGKQAEFWSESKTTAKSTVNRKRNHASLLKRPNGTINTHPQERMRAANQQEE